MVYIIGVRRRGGLAVIHSEYRKDPMPYCSHGGPGSRQWRSPRTTQELRENIRSPGFKGLARDKRRKLPTQWDDLRGYFFPKCWKDCTKRRRQWREVSMMANRT